MVTSLVAGGLQALLLKVDIVTRFHVDSDDHSLVCPLTDVQVRFPADERPYPRTFGSVLYDFYSRDARELRKLDEACPGHWHHMPVVDLWFDEDETGATTEWPRGYQL